MNDQTNALIKRARNYGKSFGFGIVWINGLEVSCTQNASGRLQWRLADKIRSGAAILAHFA